jgi:hypothetical protein
MFTFAFDSFVNTSNMGKLVGPAVKSEATDITLPRLGVVVHVLVFFQAE